MIREKRRGLLCRACRLAAAESRRTFFACSYRLDCRLWLTRNSGSARLVGRRSSRRYSTHFNCHRKRLHLLRQHHSARLIYFFLCLRAADQLVIPPKYHATFPFASDNEYSRRQACLATRRSVSRSSAERRKSCTMRYLHHFCQARLAITGWRPSTRPG